MISETLSLYLHITNSQTLKLTTMKKQEMVQVMIAEEKQLWKEMMECIDKFGMRDPFTDLAVARWSVINQLVCKLLIK